jgi:hypothetical protein
MCWYLWLRISEGCAGLGGAGWGRCYAPAPPAATRTAISLSNYPKSACATKKASQIVGKPRSAGWVLLIGTGGLKGGQMKRSARVMSFMLACAVTPAVVAQTSAHRQPANPTGPPATTQTQQQKSTQGTANRAKGAAAGAAIGAATTGNAAAGAVVGAGHSRRQERRSNR